MLAVIRQGIPNGLEQKKKHTHTGKHFLLRKEKLLSCGYVMKRHDRQIICAFISDKKLDYKIAGKKKRRCVHKFTRLIIKITTEL